MVVVVVVVEVVVVVVVVVVMVVVVSCTAKDKGVYFLFDLGTRRNTIKTFTAIMVYLLVPRSNRE